MKNLMQKPEIQFAINTVRQAAVLSARVQKEMAGDALTKKDRSPVTVADFAVQAVIGYQLGKTFPGSMMVGEESAAELKKEENTGLLEKITHYVGTVIPESSAGSVCEWIDRGNAEPSACFWCLDPIDGTKGFLRGDQYAVALSLIENGQVKLGALGCPNIREAHIPDVGGEGSVILAVRGEGTWCTSIQGENFQRLMVSERNENSDMRVLRSFESGHTNVSQIDVLSDLLGIKAEPVRMDSQAKYGVLACGQGDVLLRLLSAKQPDYKEKIWDQAAGSIIIEESGGRITDLSGKALDFSVGRTLANNSGVLATNGLYHDSVLNAIAKL